MEVDVDWTDKKIQMLRQLWSDGDTTAQIGAKLGCSKNAVIGKANRINLPHRPNPVQRQGGTPRQKTVASPIRRPKITITSSGEAAEPAAKPSAPAIPLRRFRRIQPSCCWPLGEPGASGFRFCEALCEQSRPYCANHLAVAYVKKKDHHEIML